MNDERQRNGQGKNQKGVEEEDHPEGTRNKIDSDSGNKEHDRP